MECSQAHYRIRIARLRASVPDSELIAEGTEVRPSAGDEAFFAAHPFRSPRFQLEVSECRVVGLAYAELFQGKSYRARSLHFEGPALEALVNCDKPSRPFVRSPPMVHEALAAIRQPLHRVRNRCDRWRGSRPCARDLPGSGDETLSGQLAARPECRSGCSASWSSWHSRWEVTCARHHRGQFLVLNTLGFSAREEAPAGGSPRPQGAPPCGSKRRESGGVGFSRSGGWGDMPLLPASHAKD
jgi:hypothetical protein